MGDRLGWLLVGAGLLLAAVGGVTLVLGRFVKWGQLPGDLRWERPGASVYFPLGTSLLISVVLTVILNIVVRLLRK